MTEKPSIARTLLCFPGKIVSWLILPLMVTIIISVVAAQMGWSTLLDWEGTLPVIGTSLTVNSLMDFQWYAFALIVLFGGAWALMEDRHVTVDFMAVNMKPATRAKIAIFGDLFLLLPFCALILWYGSKFTATSWMTGEGSNQGGLTAHWLIKGAMPAAFGLLGISGVVRTTANIRLLIGRNGKATESDDAR